MRRSRTYWTSRSLRSIRALLQAFVNLTPKDGHRRHAITVSGEAGNRFQLSLRQSVLDPYDFSVILTAIRPDGSLNLRRHNGPSHAHSNPIEGDRFQGVCHVQVEAVALSEPPANFRAPKMGNGQEIPAAANEPDCDIVRSFIDKLDQSQRTAATSVSRLMVVVILASVVLVVISLGVVSASNKVTISGIQFTAPLWSLLLAGGLLTYGATLMFWGSMVRAVVLQNEIESLYVQAGFQVPPGGSFRSPWGSGGAAENMLGAFEKSAAPKFLRVFEITTVVVISGALMLLPIFAEYAVCRTCLHSFKAPSAKLLYLLPLATALSTLSWVMRSNAASAAGELMRQPEPGTADQSITRNP